MALSRKTVAEAIVRGMTIANKRFEKWSNGAWISDYGVEGFMGGLVADALRKVQNEQEILLLEAPFKEIREYSMASRERGRPKTNMNDRNRADIVCFNTSGRPIHVIELKRKWDKTACFQDIERVLTLLEACSTRKSGTLRHGYVAFPIVESAENRKCLIEKIKSKPKIIESTVKFEFNDIADQIVVLHVQLGETQFYPRFYGERLHIGFRGCCLSFSRRNPEYIRRHLK